eukprot:354346-Chlamydomonas_euryale.AAC.10
MQLGGVARHRPLSARVFARLVREQATLCQSLAGISFPLERGNFPPCPPPEGGGGGKASNRTHTAYFVYAGWDSHMHTVGLYPGLVADIDVDKALAREYVPGRRPVQGLLGRAAVPSGTCGESSVYVRLGLKNNLHAPLPQLTAIVLGMDRRNL